MIVWRRKGLSFFIKNGYIPSLKKLMKVSFPDTHPEDILECMEDSIQFFIKKEKKIIAIASLVPNGGMNRKEMFYKNMLYNVATQPHFRRHGYMKKIFEAIKKDYKTINLEVYTENERAIKFYKKQDFQIKQTLHFWLENPSYMMTYKQNRK